VGHTIVEVAGLKFDAELYPEPGVWRLVDFSDDTWYGSPPVDAIVEKRSGRHGTYTPLDPTYGDLLIDVVGEIRLPIDEDVRSMYGHVADSIGLDPYEMAVTDGRGTLFGTVSKVSAQLELGAVPSIGLLRTRWRMDDPAKYGPVVSLSGSAGSQSGGGLLLPSEVV